MNVVEFPRCPPPDVSWLPADARRELARIEQWLVKAQHGMAQLDGATREHHRVLRALADSLRDEIVAEALRSR